MSFAYQRGSGLDAGRAGAYYGNRVSYGSLAEQVVLDLHSFL